MIANTVNKGNSPFQSIKGRFRYIHMREAAWEIHACVGPWGMGAFKPPVAALRMHRA
jgi:hypothetical protein